MYSVYFSNESAGDRASNLRTSCLRSSNLSVRKSFPSQVNKSNAKKHGGFPRRNIEFLNCGLPRLSSEQISPSMTALAFGTEAAICFPSSVNEANGCPLREISGRPQFKNSMFRRGNPPCFFAFDLLTCEGKDLRTERLLDRKQEVRRLLAK